MLFETISTEFGETEYTKLRSWGEALKHIQSSVWYDNCTATTFKYFSGMWITRWTRSDETSLYTFSYVGDSEWNKSDDPSVQLATIEMDSSWYSAKFAPKYKKMRLVSLVANAHLKEVRDIEQVKTIYQWISKKVLEISNG